MAQQYNINAAINAGLVIVVSIFMAFIVHVVGDLFDFGTDSETIQDLVDIMPVIVLLLGLLASFLMLRDVANGGGGSPRGM